MKNILLEKLDEIAISPNSSPNEILLIGKF